MKRIPLTQGKFALVDDEDFEWLTQWKWAFTLQRDRPQLGYAFRSKWNGSQPRAIFMHRAIMQPSSDKEVDHINGTGTDNRRANLRVCTHAENGRNRRKSPGKCSSRFKGVNWNKRSQKWEVRVQAGRRIHIGYFDDEIEAARAYNEAAQKYHGKFARLNEVSVT